jgi:hypothetical protein
MLLALMSLPLWLMPPHQPTVEKVMPIHPSVERLLTIMPKPAAPVRTGNARAWQKAEAELGIRFPDDYKSFIDVYGHGYTNEGEMVLHNPFVPSSRDWSSNYADRLGAFQTRFKYVREQFPDFPEPIWPEKQGLLPVARDGFGKEIAWRTKGRPNEWNIVVFESRGHEFEDSGWGLVDYLHDYLLWRGTFERDDGRERRTSFVFVPFGIKE